MLEWKCPEFDYHHKEAAWYALVIIVGLIIIGIAIWQRNLLFAIFIIIAVAMAIAWGGRKPNIITCRLDDKEFKLGKKTYELKEFSGFHLDDEKLALKKKGRLGSFVKVKINEDDFDKIKERLQKNLSEVEYKESLTEAISDWLGF